MSERKVAVSELALRERCQCRAELRRDVVEEYADLYRAKAKLPAVDVVDVAGALVVVDGFHRVAGARAAGEKWIRVAVVAKGTEDDAALRALAANVAHGLRRTNADKRRAVELALEHPSLADRSDAEIADRCGVSRDLVQRVRAANMENLEGAVSAPCAESHVERDEPERSTAPKKRAGKDGKAYSLPLRSRVEKSGTVAKPPTTAKPMPPAEPYAEIERVVRTAQRECVAIAKRHRLEALAQTLDELQAVARRVAHASPVVHVECEGAGCRSCQGRGWLQSGAAAEEQRVLRESPDLRRHRREAAE